MSSKHSPITPEPISSKPKTNVGALVTLIVSIIAGVIAAVGDDTFANIPGLALLDSVPAWVSEVLAVISAILIANGNRKK